MKLTLNLNKHQLDILATYAGNELDQIGEYEQAGDFDPDNPDDCKEMMERFGTSDAEEAESIAEMLQTQIAQHLTTATEQPQPYEFDVNQYQLGLLRNYVSYAQDNLKSQQGPEWDSLTDEETKLQNWGTTDYAQAMTLLDLIAEQCPRANLVQEWLEATDGDLDAPLGDGVFPSAGEYIAAGVPLKTYHHWYKVGGFDIDGMKELVAEGYDMASLGISTNAGGGGYDSTIAYKYCNGDLSMEEIEQLLEDDA